MQFPPEKCPDERGGEAAEISASFLSPFSTIQDIRIAHGLWPTRSGNGQRALDIRTELEIEADHREGTER